MSKEKLLLVGAGGFGRMVAEQAMLQYDCAFVDDGQPVGAEICGIPVVGCGCVLMQNACIQNGASVGNGVLLNAGTEVHCDAAVGEYALIYTNSVIRTGATVGNFARIGSNCTICNHATVPDGTDIPDCTAVH